MGLLWDFLSRGLDGLALSGAALPSLGGRPLPGLAALSFPWAASAWLPFSPPWPTRHGRRQHPPPCRDRAAAPFQPWGLRERQAPPPRRGNSVSGIRHGLAHFKERRLPLVFQYDHLCIGQRRPGRGLLRHSGSFYRRSGSLGGRGCLGNIFLIICHLQTSFSWHEKSQSADWPGESDLPSWFYI